MAADPSQNIAELQRRLDEVTLERDEALAQRAAAADVLRVINTSPGNLAPVFDAIVDKGARLCDAYGGALWLVEGDRVRATGGRGGRMPVELRQYLSHQSVPLAALLGGEAHDRPFIHITDLKATDAYRTGVPFVVASVDLGGVRTLVGAPIMEGTTTVGVITLIRREVRPFTEHQIALVQGFAAQAQIAMKNARLMTETKESLERQTATADILKVIAGSPADVQPVFEAIATSATALLGGVSATVVRFIGDMLQLAAFTPTSPAADAALRAQFPAPLREFPAFELVRKGETVHYPDTEAADVPAANREMGRLRGYRAMLFTPLMSNGAPIGSLGVTRKEPGAFTQHHIRLLHTFADQAAIAIENTQLFEQLQTRTKQLAASLHDLRAAQDRLVQTEKLASLGQLTAGIAHEIKNPLNFVNNFSSLSAELTDELNDALKPITLDRGARQEVDELMRMLKENLGKIVQHGRRADSIVKNMLLHSREGSGEHRRVDINALMDENFNLAYHGARAEKREFNVTLQRAFDPAAGTARVFPQEITRAFLNLISNALYALARRKAESGDLSFEPTLRAATRNLGDAVEIRIRDNGTGIPAGVREKIFNPFFTTKPAGEGTGLGLSMTHDIVVKQHGGTIDFETEPGHFTEFRVVLPRMSGPADPDNGRT